MEPSHRPQLSRRHFLPRYWPAWSVFGSFWLLAWLPMRLRAWLGDAGALVWWRLDRRRRRIILTNLALCYPHLTAAERQALARTNMRITCRVLFETSVMMFRSADTIASRVEIDGLANIAAARADGQRLIFLTPHCAPMEICGMRLGFEGDTLTMIRAHENPVMDWIVTRMRTRLGVTLYRHDASLLALVRAVRNGMWMYYLPDEDRGHPSAVFAPFFGVDKATMPMLGRLARAAGAVVVPTRSAFYPDTGRCVLYVEPPLPGFGTGDLAADARETNRLLERLIDADPAQYLWTQKLFRTRPPGEARVYG